VLAAQGISVRSGPGPNGALTFVPVNSANALIVFGPDDAMLDGVAEWARRLDQPSDDGAGGGMFIYAARHTTVETLVPVVQALIGLSGGSAAPPAQEQASGAGLGSAGAAARPMAGAGNNVSAMSGPNGQIAVDPVRNVIVFQ